MTRACVDYKPFEPSVWHWKTLDGFVEADLCEGVHRISLGGEGLTLDLQLLNWRPEMLQLQTVLPVFFSAAVGAREGRDAPFFSGGGLAAADGYAAIALSDPSLALAPDLALAWYTGSASAPAQSLIKELLDRIATKLTKDLLLVGGSGGGFAACLYAAALGDRASAFVWNPQTDILKYYRGAVRDYLRTCFGSSDVAEARARQVLDAGSVRSELVSIFAEHGAPKRLLYIQNVSDRFHVEGHALPLLSGQRMRPVGPEGFHLSSDGRVAALFGSWSQGHEAPPKTMVRAVIRRLMDPDVSALAVGRWLAGSSFAQHVPGVEYPMLLESGSTLDVNGCRADGLITATATVSAISHCSSPQLAFYLLEGESRADTRWYEPDPCAVFPDNGVNGQSVVAFCRDDFGNIIQATCPVTESPDESYALPDGARVFVLGSCVSRDAFAFFEQDNKLAGYVARTSLASGMNGAKPGGMPEDLSSIKSSWQRRMVGIDLRRELPTILAQTSFDALLLDLIDERFSVGLMDGVPFTLSPELLSLSQAPEADMRLRPDRDARWSLWCEGVEALMNLVGPDRVILNQVYWATHLDDGVALADPARAVSMNRLLRRMYEHLIQRYRLRTITYPKQVIVGARNHKWGVSPFHYSLGFYKQTFFQLGGLLR